MTIPPWASQGNFYCITKTEDELSIVCEQLYVPAEVTSERDWKAIGVVGTLDFSLTGILASLATPLAVAKISIFAISTFDTDYLLVKEAHLKSATTVLINAGFKFANQAP